MRIILSISLCLVYAGYVHGVGILREITQGASLAGYQRSEKAHATALSPIGDRLDFKQTQSIRQDGGNLALKALASVLLAFHHVAAEHRFRPQSQTQVRSRRLPISFLLINEASNQKRAKITDELLPDAQPARMTSRSSTRHGYGMPADHHMRQQIRFLSDREYKELAKQWWQETKEAFTSPPPGWPPQDLFLLSGDVVALYIGALFFTAYFENIGLFDSAVWVKLWALAPDVLMNWLQMSIPWVVAGSVTKAWDETATLPGVALPLVVRTSVDYSTASVALELITAVSQRRPGDTTGIVGHLLVGVTAVALWRVWSSLLKDS